MNLQHFHSPKLTQVIKTLQRALLLSTALLTTLGLWLAYQWQQALHSELTYFVSPQGTYPSQRRPTPRAIYREAFELENFTEQFLQHALAHNEFTYQEHLQKALQVMDSKSGLFLQSKFHDEDIFEVYTHYNGLSTLELEHIELEQKDYPYTIKAYYTIQMHFIGLEQAALQEDKRVQGGVGFRVHTTARSRANPYGLIITDFQFIPYEAKPT